MNYQYHRTVFILVSRSFVTVLVLRGILKFIYSTSVKIYLTMNLNEENITKKNFENYNIKIRECVKNRAVLMNDKYAEF